MKKLKYVVALSLLSISFIAASDWTDEIRGKPYTFGSSSDEPSVYIGGSINSFAISTESIKATDPSINFSVTSTGEARDSGSASGFMAGFFLGDNGKINLSKFSGDEKDSGFLTATVQSISYDHSFNNSGSHRGWFLGGGFSSVEIEAEATSLTTAGVNKANGPMLRGGYEYLFDSGFYIEVGFNAHLAEVDLIFTGTGSQSSLIFESKMDVSNAYFALNYAF
jgi:hypothetical protein